jgi:hypothetical protein
MPSAIGNAERDSSRLALVSSPATALVIAVTVASLHPYPLPLRVDRGDRRLDESRLAFAGVRLSVGSRPSRSAWLPVTGLLRVESTDMAGHPSPLVPLATPRQSGAAAAFRLFTEAFSPDVHSGLPRGKVTNAVSFLWRWELAGHPPSEQKAALITGPLRRLPASGDLRPTAAVRLRRPRRRPMPHSGHRPCGISKDVAAKGADRQPRLLIRTRRRSEMIGPE